jgi:uncharacterized protein YsxB (DUF464 family)
MTKLKLHYITNTQKNAAEALSMAMQLWGVPHKECDKKGLQDLIKIINTTAISLRNLAQSYEREINGKLKE